MTKDTITNENGHLRSATGKGVLAFRLKCMIVALEFRQKTGMEIDRRFNTLKLAKAETGLKTRDIPTLIEALRVKMNAIISECDVVTDGVKQ